MDIELTADNLMEYMGDEDPNTEQIHGEAMLMQHMEEMKKGKEDKKETRYP